MFKPTDQRFIYHTPGLFINIRWLGYSEVIPAAKTDGGLFSLPLDQSLPDKIIIIFRLEIEQAVKFKIQPEKSVPLLQGLIQGKLENLNKIMSINAPYISFQIIQDTGYAFHPFTGRFFRKAGNNQLPFLQVMFRPGT